MIDVEELLQRAMELPPEARAALANSLLESLESGTDPDAEAAWAAEIERRLHDLDSGQTQTVSWSEARGRISG